MKHEKLQHLKIPRLTDEEHGHLHTLVHGNPLLHPVFPDHIKESLISHGLAREVVGGSLKATDHGMMVMYAGQK